MKQEDPYGGSTDENTDAEAEEDHPIPELPGRSPCPPVSFVCSYHRNMSFLTRPTLQTLTESNWMAFCLSGTQHTNVEVCIVVFFGVFLFSPFF